MSLKCQNIKIIKKKYDNYTDVFYLIYLEIGSIRLNDLRKNVRSIFKTQVKWDFARRQRNKLTQCYNCQMFGHGEKNCHIKTYCAICAETHETSACKSSNIKCANCNGTHKASDPSCMSRQSFYQVRERLATKNKIQPLTKIVEHHSFVANMTDFPALKPRRQTSVSVVPKPTTSNNTNVWSKNNNNTTTNGSNKLFSMQEINALTAEMLTLLGNCSSKAEQFNVITSLAIKYVYQGK